MRKANGAPSLLTNPFTAGTVAEVDFTNPEAERFWQDLVREPIADGYDGWMEDFREYRRPMPSSPTAARASRCTTATRWSTTAPRTGCAPRWRWTGRPCSSGPFHGVQPFARIVWGGDPTEDWSCSDGLCAAVDQALSMGLTGVAYSGSDIGGFHAIANGRTTDELNTRWLQFGAVSGVTRTPGQRLPA